MDDGDGAGNFEGGRRGRFFAETHGCCVRVRSVAKMAVLGFGRPLLKKEEIVIVRPRLQVRSM